MELCLRISAYDLLSLFFWSHDWFALEVMTVLDIGQFHRNFGGQLANYISERNFIIQLNQQYLLLGTDQDTRLLLKMFPSPPSQGRPGAPVLKKPPQVFLDHSGHSSAPPQRLFSLRMPTTYQDPSTASGVQLRSPRVGRAITINPSPQAYLIVTRTFCGVHALLKACTYVV